MIGAWQNTNELPKEFDGEAGEQLAYSMFSMETFFFLCSPQLHSKG